MKYSFKNDYSENCSPEILEEIAKINLIQKDGYGTDNYSEEVRRLLKNQLADQSVDIHFMVGGTITNLTLISHILKPYEAVVAAESAHIAVHETGAIEACGHKICIASSRDGKLYKDDIEKVINAHSDYHMVLPKMVFISNSTEYGTFYTKEELIDLYNYCQHKKLYLYLDGARIASALTAHGNDLTLEDINNYTDCFYIGATKNGGMLGEALVIKSEELKRNFKYSVKMRGGLMAKGSLIAAQFKVLFERELFYQNALHANKAAMIIKDVFEKNNYEIIYGSTTNQIFVKMSLLRYGLIASEYAVTLVEESENYVVVRFVTSFNTSIEECEKFKKFINQLGNDY